MCATDRWGKRYSRKLCADSGGCACGPKVAYASEKTSGSGVRVTADAALQKRFGRCARQFPMVALGGLWTQLASLLVKFPGAKVQLFSYLQKGFELTINTLTFFPPLFHFFYNFTSQFSPFQSGVFLL